MRVVGDPYVIPIGKQLVFFVQMENHRVGTCHADYQTMTHRADVVAGWCAAKKAGAFSTDRDAVEALRAALGDRRIQ